MAVHLALLRSIMGKEYMQIYRNLSLSPEQQESIQGCLDALEVYFKPQRNVVYRRYVFNSCVQSQDESVDAYLTGLRKTSLFLWVWYANQWIHLWLICQLDTGVLCNMISYWDLSILLQNGTLKLGESSVKLKMYDGSIMRPMGKHV